MARSPRLLPDEWVTATHSLQLMNRAGGPVRGTWLRSCIGFGVPFAIGAGVASLLLPAALLADASILVTAAAGILAFCGLLAGFGVTLMLFTGRIENTEDLKFEQLRGYIIRIRYLLASQASTLFAALISALLTLVWCLLIAADFGNATLFWLGLVIAGFTTVCLARSFLLPMQIYELHEARLRDVLEAKEKQVQAHYSRSVNNATD